MGNDYLKRTLDILTDKNKDGWKRFWLLIVRLSLLIIFLLLVIIIIYELFPKTSVEKVEALGNTIYFKTKDKDLYYYLFPASDLWANPGIEFDAGDNVTIVASGKYNTAIHHLVDYAKTDTSRFIQWIGPEGIPLSLMPRPADKIRFKGRIDTTANYGALLVRQLSSGSNEMKIFHYDQNEKKIRIRFEKPGSIEFCVNEVILDTSETSKSLYIITKKEDEKYVSNKSENEQKIAWEKIKKEGSASHLWFDDNIGELFIVIERKTSN